MKNGCDEVAAFLLSMQLNAITAHANCARCACIVWLLSKQFSVMFNVVVEIITRTRAIIIVVITVIIMLHLQAQQPCRKKR